MIETSGLTKRFDDILAVDHISAKIRDGSPLRKGVKILDRILVACSTSPLTVSATACTGVVSCVAVATGVADWARNGIYINTINSLFDSGACCSRCCVTYYSVF